MMSTLKKTLKPPKDSVDNSISSRISWKIKLIIKKS